MMTKPVSKSYRMVDWLSMLTHEQYDELEDRAFVFYHRDMGPFFEHKGLSSCECGPLRCHVMEAQSPTPAHFHSLDQRAHRMVN